MKSDQLELGFSKDIYANNVVYLQSLSCKFNFRDPFAKNIAVQEQWCWLK